MEDVFNAITVTGNAVGDVMFYGRGAGKLPTASAVVADVIAAARQMDRDRHRPRGGPTAPTTWWSLPTVCQLPLVRPCWPQWTGRLPAGESSAARPSGGRRRRGGLPDHRAP